MTAFGAGYKLESQESRALGSITPESYDYRDQGKLMSKLVNDVSYMGQYMREMQRGIDAANENFIQQIGDLIADIFVIFSGNGNTGFDFGDLKYVFQAIGSLFGFDEQTGLAAIFPINLFSAAWHFFSTYIVPIQGFQDILAEWLDNALATLLDIFGEVPIVGQALQQLAVWLTQLRDWAGDSWTFITTVLNEFTQPIVDFLVALAGKIEDLFGGLGTAFMDAVKFIIDIFENIAEVFAPWTGGLISGITDAFNTAKTNLLNAWTSVFGDLNLFDGSFTLIPFIGSIVNAILGWAGDLLNIDLSDWINAIQNLMTWWTDWFGDINIWDSGFDVLTLLGGVFTAIPGWIGQLLGIDLSGWLPSVQNAMNWWTDFFGDLNIWDELFDVFELFGKIFEGMLTNIGNLLTIDLSGWQTAVENVLTWWTNIFGNINIFNVGFNPLDLLEKLAENLKDFIFDILPFNDLGAWIDRTFIQPIVGIFTGDALRLDLASLGDAVGKFLTQFSPINVAQLFGTIPQRLFGVLPVASIAERSDNMLDPQGGFDISASVEGATGWDWDSTEGSGTTGCVKLVCDGGLHQLYTRIAVPVSERDQIYISAKMKTVGYSGIGTPFRLNVIPFKGDVQQSTIIIDSQAESTTWLEMADTIVIEEDVTSIFVMLEVLATASAGTVYWDDVGVYKTGTMPQTLVDKLEDVWESTTQLIDDGLDINPFDAGTPLFNIFRAFRIQQDSLIGANSTIEKLQGRIVALEDAGKAVAIDDFERVGSLIPVWNVTEIGSGDGNIQLDGHHAYWSESILFADDNYALCRFIGGGNYGDQHSNTAYQYVSAIVNAGPWQGSWPTAPAIDLLAMLADDNSSYVRARWTSTGQLILSYLEGGNIYDLTSVSTSVPSAGSIIALKVGNLATGEPDKITVIQNSQEKISSFLDGSYDVHSYKNNRGWGFGFFARSTPLLGQFSPGSLHQWQANDQ